MSKTNKQLSMSKKSFVVYWNNIPAPYMVERFNALAERGNLNFEAWFNERLESDRSWEVEESAWKFKYRYMPSTKVLGRSFHWPSLLLAKKPQLLVSLYAEPSFIVGWLLAKIRGVVTGFWVEVTFDRWVVRSSIKNMIKRWLFKYVDAVVTVGADGKQFALENGATTSRIYFAPHTIDVVHYQEGSDRVRLKRNALREELRLSGTTFVYVGRLWWGKGIDCLIDAFEAVQRKSEKPVSLLLVGDGPEESKLKQHCAERGIRNVVFTGFKQKSEIPQYYAVSDVFVFPTLGDPYGLVVDEAMACSLPVISTSSAGEIHNRIDKGVNGYIVPPDDSEALAEYMLQLVDDPVLRMRMGKESFEKIKGNTPEKWAEDFERITMRLLGKQDG